MTLVVAVLAQGSCLLVLVVDVVTHVGLGLSADVAKLLRGGVRLDLVVRCARSISLVGRLVGLGYVFFLVSLAQELAAVSGFVDDVFVLIYLVFERKV